MAETYFKKNKMKGAVCICDNSISMLAVSTGPMIRHIIVWHENVGATRNQPWHQAGCIDTTIKFIFS